MLYIDWMERTNPTLVKRINSKLSVCLKSVEDRQALEGKLWAMNSLNLKSAFGYHLYLLMASPLARKVGAKLVFKGKLKQLVSGEARKARKVLLIVRYDNGHRFLDLVGNKIFQFLSLLRIKSVKDFNFGFTKNILANRENGNRVRPDNTKCFLVFHFKMAGGIKNDLDDFLNKYENKEVPVVFAGVKVAEIGRQIRSDDPQMMTLLFDGLLLFQASSFIDFENLQGDPAFIRLTNVMEGNFIAHYTSAF